MLHRLIAEYDMYLDLFILKEQIYHDQVHKTKFMISAFESAQLSAINYILVAVRLSPLPASKPFITPERYFVAIGTSLHPHTSLHPFVCLMSRIGRFYTCHVSRVKQYLSLLCLASFTMLTQCS